MTQLEAQTNFDRVFKASILIKAVDGALETIGGALLVFVKPASINHLVVTLTQHELVEDPRDFIANHLLHASHALTGGAVLFGALYLIGHGLSKIFLVGEILRHHLWAFRALIIITAGFVVYQVYRVSYTHSVTLTILALYDGLVVYLTAKEYQKQKVPN